MAKPIDQTTARILKEYGQDPKEALWDCHGTWVMYHKYVERIAALAGIKFSMESVVQADTANKIAVICVKGTMGEREEWSFGEASPANNKNSYPWAMAEKRAKDRVALKLIGLAGFVYSEEEADDFKASPPQAQEAVPDEYRILHDTILQEVRMAPDLGELQSVWKGYASDLGDLKANFPDLFSDLESEKDAKKTALTKGK